MTTGRLHSNIEFEYIFNDRINLESVLVLSLFVWFSAPVHCGLGNFSLNSIFNLQLTCFVFCGLGRVTCCFRTNQKYVAWFLGVLCFMFSSLASCRFPVFDGCANNANSVVVTVKKGAGAIVII